MGISPLARSTGDAQGDDRHAAKLATAVCYTSPVMFYADKHGVLPPVALRGRDQGDSRSGTRRSCCRGSKIGGPSRDSPGLHGATRGSSESSMAATQRSFITWICPSWGRGSSPVCSCPTIRKRPDRHDSQRGDCSGLTLTAGGDGRWRRIRRHVHAGEQVVRSVRRWDGLHGKQQGHASGVGCMPWVMGEASFTVIRRRIPSFACSSEL
jgi:hypothetical protein